MVVDMKHAALLVLVSVLTFGSTSTSQIAAQSVSKTLLAVFAHPDDETVAAPILARYARDGAQVYMIFATNGAAGVAHTSIAAGAELAQVRGEEARCAANALGIQPPILLGFPDAQLGSYREDPSRLFQLTARIQAEVERLRPGAVITWGPDGGTGHPDHRLVSSIVTQLVRAGAPGMPERVFYASFPPGSFHSMNPTREEPPFYTPLPKYFTVRVAFSPDDFEASRRAMVCHKSQYSDEVVQRVSDYSRNALKGEMALAPLFPTGATTDLFR
jgi:N-acetyl-1-D-myo-inositol-2-amino-2-deoxy-alpha-D-glucopyranoside deacetylase